MTTKSCTFRWRAIAQVSLGGFRAFSDSLFKHLFYPGSTSFCLFSEAPCLGPRLLFFFVMYLRDWSDVTVVLVELCWTPRRLHISSTTAIDYSYFPEGIAVRTLLFGRSFAKLEDLGVHVGDQVLRFFAEIVNLLRLAQVGARTSRSTS